MIDGLLLRAVRLDLLEWIGARVQQVRDPAERALLIELFLPGRGGGLLLLDAGASPRIHLTLNPPSNPREPSALCRLFRSRLVGCRLADVSMDGLERVMELRFERPADDGAPLVWRLYAEVMGRRSNVILVGGDGRVVDALRRASPEANPRRPVWPGLPYAWPPRPERPPDSAAAAEAFWRERGDRFEPCRVVRDGTTVRFGATELAPGPGEEVERFATASALLDAVFAETIGQARLDARLERARRAARVALERASRRLDHRRREWAEAEKAEEWRHLGDLLTANLHAVTPGSARVEVEDWEREGATRAIELDPRLSPSRNAQAFFARYQKARRRRAELKPRLQASEAEVARIVEGLAWLERAEPGEPEVEGRLAEWEAFLAGLARGGARPRPLAPRAKASRRLAGAARAGRTGAGPGRPRAYLSSDGWTILVGKNSRQNEWLSLRHGRPDDWWFHTKDIPGTHVLVRAPDGWPAGDPPPEATLREAASLAAFFSQARQGGNVPVDYTRCRYVRRRRGAGPGQVTYDHHRTAFVTPSENTLRHPAPGAAGAPGATGAPEAPGGLPGGGRP